MKERILFFCLLIITFPCFAGDCDFIQNNTCKSCNSPRSFLVGSVEACSFLCPGRIVNYYGSGNLEANINCVLEKCPDFAPFQGESGNCYETEALAEEDAFALEDDDNFDNDNIDHSEYKTEPIGGKCPQNFVLTRSGCISCNDPETWTTTKLSRETYPREETIQETCQLCKNRVYKIDEEGDLEQCEATCPQKNQFKRWDGTCFSCDTPKAIRIESHCTMRDYCNDICPNRTIIKLLGGNGPSILSCPSDKPMMDDEGVCYSCDTPIPIGVRWNENFCHRFCPNERHLEGSVCVLNDKGK